jgi:hypothetical protein
MNILFIGYWSFHEGLTQATILPHLKVLSEMPEVKKVVLTSIERAPPLSPFCLSIPKTTHISIYSRNLPFNLLNKIYDFYHFPKILLKIIQKHQIDKIICRGSPAGALGYLIWKKTKIPYVVESFEPHADYMLESSVWKHYDPRFLMQRYWEKKQKQTANGLMPVAENYRQKLINEGVASNKIVTVPCSVDIARFIYNQADRSKTRSQLGIKPNRVVGIYVGKFGGIYYDDEAFKLIQSAFQYFNNFFLIILTPQKITGIRNKLKSHFILSNYHISSKPHLEIPRFLSAADFAFSLYLPSPSKKYLSPIKHGEYWANGLPILVPDGIGDDSEIIKNEGGGAIIKWDDLCKSFKEVEDIIAVPEYRRKIPELAVKYRNPERAVDAYNRLLFH